MIPSVRHGIADAQALGRRRKAGTPARSCIEVANRVKCKVDDAEVDVVKG